MQTSPFSITLGRKSLGALAAHRASTDETSQLSPRQTKLKVMESFQQLRESADKTASQAMDTYGKHINRRVCHLAVFCRKDLVNVDRPLTDITVAQGLSDKNRSRKLRPKKDGSYPLMEGHDHTLTANINGIRNVESIDKASHAKANVEVFFFSTPTSPTMPDESPNSEVCPPQTSKYEN